MILESLWELGLFLYGSQYLQAHNNVLMTFFFWLHKQQAEVPEARDQTHTMAVTSLDP